MKHLCFYPSQELNIGYYYIYLENKHKLFVSFELFAACSIWERSILLDLELVLRAIIR